MPSSRPPNGHDVRHTTIIADYLQQMRIPHHLDTSYDDLKPISNPVRRLCPAYALG